MTVAEWGLVGATVGLVFATLVLARFTYRLYKATGQLAKATEQLRRIEEQRDREEARRRRRNRLEEKLKCANEVINMPTQQVLDILAKGSVPEGQARILHRLHGLIDFGIDQVIKQDVHRLLLALDSASGGAIFHEDVAEDLRKVFVRVQERLKHDLFKWRHEVIALSPPVPKGGVDES